MARNIKQREVDEILMVVRDRSGLSSADIWGVLGHGVKYRTLQYRLMRLVEKGQLLREGDDRWARYRLAEPTGPYSAGRDEAGIGLSAEAQEILSHVRKPLSARKPIGYDRAFLRRYKPNQTSYLPLELRRMMAGQGAQQISAQQPAGTFARTILNRLLIDLSWNSSRLEGNTYSLLETRRLIEFGQQARGRSSIEAQMILNHKDAIEYLVDNAVGVGLNRGTILQLHAILAQNLLVDPAAAGRLRQIAVGIEGSVYLPPEVPQFIEECFDEVLAIAEMIEDPFEQSLFLMVHLPHLQPFDDVNKRVSRMAANIPFIRANLCPLSFTDLPRELYTLAMLGVYELNRVELLRDVFVWSYERSASRYTVLRQTIGEPDPLRLRYRDVIRIIVAEVVRGLMSRPIAASHLEQSVKRHADPADREALRDILEVELLSMHEGNYARYRITTAEYDAWQGAWQGR